MTGTMDGSPWKLFVLSCLVVVDGSAQDFGQTQFICTSVPKDMDLCTATMQNSGPAEDLKTTVMQLRETVLQQKETIMNQKETIRELSSKLSRCESQSLPAAAAGPGGRRPGSKNTMGDVSRGTTDTLAQLGQTLQTLKQRLENLEVGTTEGSSGGKLIKLAAMAAVFVPEPHVLVLLLPDRSPACRVHREPNLRRQCVTVRAGLHPPECMFEIRMSSSPCFNTPCLPLCAAAIQQREQHRAGEQPERPAAKQDRRYGEAGSVPGQHVRGDQTGLEERHRPAEQSGVHAHLSAPPDHRPGERCVWTSERTGLSTDQLSVTSTASNMSSRSTRED